MYQSDGRSRKGGKGKGAIDATEERKKNSSICGRGVGCPPQAEGVRERRLIVLSADGLAVTEIDRNN